ncbi:MAG: type III pantothenate kinase [Nitrospiraceae bacterium]|nr:MAG: type III pantothenate kinase [Nitrospiraceae bacterium]
MLLLIDIGNSNVKIGFHKNGGIKAFNTATQRNADEYSHILEMVVKKHKIGRPDAAALCSVVPDVTLPFSAALKKSFGITPMTLTHKTKTGITFPKGIGTDRMACVVAARRLHKGDLVVVTFGTATTLNVITGDGKYRGGAIMPGLQLSADALSEKTAKLPKVSLKLPDKILNKDTEGNILTGIIVGHAGAAGRIIQEMEKELGHDLTVVVTGGLASLVTPYLKTVDFVNPFLTLEGLRFIYEFNNQ